MEQQLLCLWELKSLLFSVAAHKGAHSACRLHSHVFSVLLTFCLGNVPGLVGTRGLSQSEKEGAGPKKEMKGEANRTVSTVTGCLRFHRGATGR